MRPRAATRLRHEMGRAGAATNGSVAPAAVGRLRPAPKAARSGRVKREPGASGASASVRAGSSQRRQRVDQRLRQAGGAQRRRDQGRRTSMRTSSRSAPKIRCSRSSEAPPIRASAACRTSSRSSRRAGARKSITQRRTVNASPKRARRLPCVEADAAQHLGPGALGEAQVVGVIDHTRRRRYPRSKHAPPADVRPRRSRRDQPSASRGRGRRTARLSRVARRLEAEMAPGGAGQQPAARRALQQALLQQVGLDHLLQRVALLRQRRRQRVDADRPAAVVVGDAAQIAAIEAVEAERVDLELGQRPVGDRGVDLAVAFDRGEVAHPPQQAGRDPGRAAGAPRDLGSAIRVRASASRRRRARRSPRARRGRRNAAASGCRSGRAAAWSAGRCGWSRRSG